MNTSAFVQLMHDHQMPGGSEIYHDNFMNVSDIAALAALWESGQRTAIVASLTDC